MACMQYIFYTYNFLYILDQLNVNTGLDSAKRKFNLSPSFEKHSLFSAHFLVIPCRASLSPLSFPLTLKMMRENDDMVHPSILAVASQNPFHQR